MRPTWLNKVNTQVHNHKDIVIAHWNHRVPKGYDYEYEVPLKDSNILKETQPFNSIHPLPLQKYSVIH